RGRALRQVVRTFGRPTFMLRTHSWAQSYPIQYEAEDPADLELITDETFLRDFADAAAVLQPRYAVPFANMVAFLHPQAAAANDHLITPDRVQAACAADGRLAAVEVVPLGPGDSWRAGEGFARAGGRGGRTGRRCWPDGPTRSDPSSSAPPPRRPTATSTSPPSAATWSASPATSP